MGLNVPIRSQEATTTMIDKIIHKTILYAMTFIGLLLTLSSCQDENIIDNRDNGRITFCVSDKVQSDNGEWKEADSKGEKLQAPNKSIVEIGGKQLNLLFVREENKNALNQGCVTRGAAFDNNTHRITQIYTTAIYSNGSRGGNIYFENEKISINNSQGCSTHFWPTDKLSFYAYAYSKENVTIAPIFTQEGKMCKGVFDYTLPTPSTSDTKEDAKNQPDVVFAIAPDKSHQTSDDVDLVFHHALSAITFKVGKMPENVFLKSITLSGVYKSGNCSMTATEDNNIDFTWTFAGEQQNGAYTQDIKTNAVVGNIMGDEEATFMMLPQNMGSNTKFRLTFSIDNREYSLEKSFNTFITSWDADKKYIFTIGLPDEIDVEIDDQVVGMEKSNVTIQNTGIITGYIRAAIVGYWKNAGGMACDIWIDSDGTFSYGSQWNNYWKKGADGFYYYLHPVEHNEYTYPLFDRYVISDNTLKNHINQSLEIDLAVQIIPVENKSVWSELDNI